MKRAVREDLNHRYKEKAKRIMHIACFFDPPFKSSFLDEPEAATHLKSCVCPGGGLEGGTCTSQGRNAKHQQHFHHDSSIGEEKLGWIVEKDYFSKEPES